MMLSINSSIFGMEIGDRLRALSLEVAKGDVPSYLCKKALDQGRTEVAKYIGLKFIGARWTSCHEYCKDRDAQGPQVDFMKPIDQDSKNLVTAEIVIKAVQERRYDVLAFIGENTESEDFRR
ncbi:MAG: hypothetical protein ACXWL5_03595 [Candidatus Chromulinivorax sp.]